MDKLHIKAWIIIIASFLVALFLTILPLPNWAVWLRPAWVPLVTIYWVLVLPYRVSFGGVWAVGLILDGLSGTLVGEHALALIVVAYIAVTVHRQLRVFPLWQQAFTVLGLVVVYQSLLLLAQGVSGQLTYSQSMWLPALTSMVLWPWVFMVLHDVRRRYNIGSH